VPDRSDGHHPGARCVGPAAEGVQPVFITIDPERDSKLLADYLSAFHRRFVGLTGAPDEIRKVANSYKAFYAKVLDGQGAGYSIDHTGVIYLMAATAGISASCHRRPTRTG